MTVISNNPEIMLGYILSTQSDEIAAAGLNIKVKDGASYTTSEGIVLKENSEFNISIQNGAVALKAVGSGVSAQYDLSKTNWTANTGETLFEETFSNGEYITSAVLLAKAGVTQLTGTEIVWSVSGNKYSITLNIVTDGVYTNANNTYLSLAQDESSQQITDPVTGAVLYTTALTGVYGENKKRIYNYCRSKSKYFRYGISILNAGVYTDGMYIKPPEQSAEGGETPEETNPEIPYVFSGTFNGNAEGGTVSGIFYNYSDAAIAQVFSIATVFNVGSQLSRNTVIDGKTLGYDYKITGQNDAGQPIFAFATTAEETRYVEDNFQTIADQITSSEFVNSSGIGVTVKYEGGQAVGLMIDGSDKVYGAADIIDGTFITDLSEISMQKSEGETIQITQEMRDRADAIFTSIYGDGEDRNNHSDEYLMRTGIREDFTGYDDDFNPTHAYPDLNSENCDLYSDTNIYFINMLYDSALAQSGNNEQQAMALVGTMWKFAADVWFYSGGQSVSISSNDSMSAETYFI
jgi:hypothetical protein